MSTRISRRGSALIMVLILVAVTSVVVESVVRITYSRAASYRGTRDRLRAGIVARSALAELNGCVDPASVPPTACGPAWPWACSGGTCFATKTFPMGPDDFTATASWTPAGELLEISVSAP